jgi:glycosyltransferase involved in cell wall biosynthesis
VSNYPIQYKNRLHKIYNGIPKLELNCDAQKVLTKWNLPANVPLILNIGRLARQKNQGTLIESLKYMTNTHLLLIGEGELRDSLEKQVIKLQLQARVHFLGELKSEDVLALLTIAKVFVFPSLYEAMPMALIEAMGSGIPIVGGDIPAMREILGNAGIIVPSENAEAIARAVTDIIASPELADRLQKSSIQRASLFSVQKMVESYEKLFN